MIIGSQGDLGARGGRAIIGCVERRRRPKVLALYIALSLVAAPSTVAAQEATRQLETRQGLVRVEGGRSVTIDGKPLAIKADYSVDIVQKFETDTSTAVLFRKSDGGNACPATYQWLILGPGGYRVSDDFGNCSDLAEVSQLPGRYVVSLPSFDQMGPTAKRTGTTTYIFDGSDIQTTEDRSVVSSPEAAGNVVPLT